MPEARIPYSFDSVISYPLAKWICSICHFSFLTANGITVARLIPGVYFFGRIYRRTIIIGLLSVS